jgi:hypothetical protein
LPKRVPRTGVPQKEYTAGYEVRWSPLRKEDGMRKSLIVATAAIAILMLGATAAWATSNAHFVGTPTATRNADNTLTVQGKVAGLGQVNEIHVDVNADVACINPGAKHPKAANKEAITAGGNFPVQNGKANFSVTTGVPAIAPSCSPPMTLQYSNVTVTVTTVPDDGTFLFFSFPGTF